MYRAAVLASGVRHFQIRFFFRQVSSSSGARTTTSSPPPGRRTTCAVASRVRSRPSRRRSRTPSRSSSSIPSTCRRTSRTSGRRRSPLLGCVPGLLLNRRLPLVHSTGEGTRHTLVADRPCPDLWIRYFSRLRTEINNGRLAMLGIMAFLAESKVPGSVPALGGLGIAPYSGEVRSRALCLCQRQILIEIYQCYCIALSMFQISGNSIFRALMRISVWIFFPKCVTA